ncbi:MAG: hypothetical protein ABTD50_18655 [Polyangiaceae bacterium]
MDWAARRRGGDNQWQRRLGALDVGVLGSLLIQAAALSLFPADDEGGSDSNEARTHLIEVGVALGAGLALMGLGLPLMRVNDRSGVSQATDAPMPQPTCGLAPQR